jgi:hypothetical protein
MGTRRLRQVAVIGLMLVGSTRASAPAPSWAGPADQLDANLIVQFTSPAPGDYLRGGVMIQGYAGDRRSASGSGINESDVQLYLDAPPGPVDLRSLLAVPGTDRSDELSAPDPGCCAPELPTALGFRSPWDTCTFPPGRHTLTAWVSSLVVPGAQNRTDVEVDVAACAPGQIEARNDLAAAGNRVVLEQPMAISVGEPAGVAAIRANFAVGVDARCSTTAVHCRSFIEFRSVPGPRTRQGSQVANEQYKFYVDPTDGTFLLIYVPPGDEANRAIPLLPATPAAAIHRGAEWNRLAVIADGPRLRLFVNGEQVGEANDDRRPWGDVRWGGSSLRTDRALEVQFKNLVVSTVGDVAALAPVLRGQ